MANMNLRFGTVGADVKWPAWPAFAYLGLSTAYAVVAHGTSLSAAALAPTLALAVAWIGITAAGRLLDSTFGRRGPWLHAPWLWAAGAPLAGAAVKLAALQLPAGSAQQGIFFRIAALAIMVLVACFFAGAAYRSHYESRARGGSYKADGARLTDTMLAAVMLALIVST